MDEPRHQFFTSAGFATYHHRKIGPGDPGSGFDDIDHCGAIAQNLLLRSFQRMDFYQFAGIAALLDRGSDGLKNADRKMLANVIVGPSLDGVNSRLYGRLASH